MGRSNWCQFGTELASDGCTFTTHRGTVTDGHIQIHRQTHSLVHRYAERQDRESETLTNILTDALKFETYRQACSVRVSADSVFAWR